MARVQKTAALQSEKGRIVAAPTPTGGPTPETIAARAYEIWQSQGCPQGRDAENWFQAERELREQPAP